MDESVPAVENAQASDDTTAVDAASAPTAAIAKAAAEDNGHMQQDQQDHGVGAGESAPFAGTADDGSLFSAAAATTTTTAADTDNTAPSGHATGEHKEPTPPTDLAASPRSGATGFVAPSSYLRPLAATRDREGPHRTGNQPFTASESGAKRPMHPLDREQREGLVSGFSSAASRNAKLQHSYGYMLARKRWLTVYTARNQSLSQGPHDLRCSAAELPIDCTGYGAVSQEEFEHPHTMR